MDLSLGTLLLYSNTVARPLSAHNKLPHMQLHAPHTICPTQLSCLPILSHIITARLRYKVQWPDYNDGYNHAASRL